MHPSAPPTPPPASPPSPASAAPPAPSPLLVACLCAAWCRTCDGYRALFDGATAAAVQPPQRLVARWIDIEDEAELVGDVDVETFPMLVIADRRGIYFAGPLTPQPETLQRVLRAALAQAAADAPPAAAASASAATADPALPALVQRLLDAG